MWHHQPNGQGEGLGSSDQTLVLCYISTLTFAHSLVISMNTAFNWLHRILKGLTAGVSDFCRIVVHVFGHWQHNKGTITFYQTVLSYNQSSMCYAGAMDDG